MTNGLVLCKIHHAAYDRNLLGITPDYGVDIDRDLLDEVDEVDGRCCGTGCKTCTAGADGSAPARGAAAGGFAHRAVL